MSGCFVFWRFCANSGPNGRDSTASYWVRISPLPTEVTSLIGDIHGCACLAALKQQPLSAEARYEALVIPDIRAAASFEPMA